MAAQRRVRRHRGRRKKGNWFTRMKVWQRVLVCFVGVLLCLSAGAAVYAASKWSKINTEKIKTEDLVINQNAELDLGDGYTNVALFGVDSRDGNLGKGNRTDCIIVASLNNETKEVKMISVYRDTLLDLSEGTYQKCNAAYSYGGPVMAINMLNKNLDLNIEDYVTVDFGAIADAIDLLGGVEIDVKEEEVQYLNKYVSETARSAGKKANKVTKSGLQLLDGTQATTYARIRSTAGGDFTRTERQRLVIEKIVEKAKKTDLGTINAIIDKVFPQVSTSFSLTEILKYASAYSEYVLADNEGFPFDKTTATVGGLGSIVIPQDLVSNVSKLHEFLFGTENYTPSSVVQTLSGNIAAKVSAAGSATNSSSTSSSEESYSYSQEESYQSGGSSSSGSTGTGQTTTPSEPEQPAPEPEQPEPEPENPGGTGGETGGSTGGGTEGGTEGGTQGGGTDTEPAP